MTAKTFFIKDKAEAGGESNVAFAQRGCDGNRNIYGAIGVKDPSQIIEKTYAQD